MKKKYEILSHLADYKIRAYGKTKEEVFKNALLGMENGLRPKVKSQKSKVKSIKIKSPDLETLLVDFLSEVLYLNQVNKEIYFDCQFKKFSDSEIEGKLIGQKVERFDKDIKAVTYHGLEIKKNKIWQATILFDI